MTAHAKLSASSSSRWMTCPASVKATEGMVDRGSIHAQEGTTAHSLAEMALNEEKSPYDFDGFTDEMQMNVQKYVDYVHQLWSPSSILEVEIRVDLREWIPDGFGTSDVIITDFDEGVVHVVDLKYGRGVKVDAENNTQAMLYGLGALGRFDPWELMSIQRVHLHIVQPRIGNYSEWSITKDALLAWGDDVVIPAAKRCFDADAPFVVSEKGCQWCLAKATCPALYEHNMKLITDDFDNLDEVTEIVPVKPDTVAPEKLRLIMDNKRLLEKWLAGIEEYIFSTIEHGGTFEGYKMVEGRSVRKWKDDAETQLLAMGYTAIYDHKMKGITELEKLIGTKAFAEMDLTEKPEGKPTLAPESDKRQPMKTINDDFEVL